MQYGDGFFNGTQQSINDSARAKYNIDLYLPYIAPEYQHKTKTETTLMGTVAFCAFCPVWCVLPVRRPAGCHWAIHTCVNSLEIEEARAVAAEMARREWVEKMKRSRHR